MNKEQQALQLIEEHSKGKNFESLALKTGFRKEKLFQWAKLKKLPSAKVAKQILKSL
jgi:hypothetical protein